MVRQDSVVTASVRQGMFNGPAEYHRRAFLLQMRHSRDPSGRMYRLSGVLRCPFLHTSPRSLALREVCPVTDGRLGIEDVDLGGVWVRGVLRCT
jgi:hypothetical protein